MDRGGGEVVVVPHQPGPVRPLPAPAQDRDELDEIADELLGADDERPPGGVDAILVAGGSGLAGWAALFDGQPWALPVGGVLVVLGAALPVRSAATALEGRPAADAASRRFVAERAEAVAALADALEGQPAAQRDQLLEARREVVAAGGFDALTVLGDLVDEVRSGGHRHT